MQPLEQQQPQQQPQPAKWAHDAIYRRKTTVAEIASGVFSVGDKLTITDRDNSDAEISLSGAANGTDILSAGAIPIIAKQTAYDAASGLITIKFFFGAWVDISTIASLFLFVKVETI